MTELLEDLRAERDSFDDALVPRHPNSYRRDRYERYDELTRQIATLEDTHGEC
jgi:hypothetical protein